MKIKLEKVKEKQGNKSFLAYELFINQMNFDLHYHPEFELTWIEKGNGKRMIGNQLSDFTNGDLALLGSNLPHTWFSKEENFRAIIIQFSPEFIETFLTVKEFQDIQNLLKNAQNGLLFQQERTLVTAIQELVSLNDFEKILGLLKILETLSESNGESLTNQNYFTINQLNEKRINKVCHYIQMHYQEEISLKKMAELLHFSESNFCKFFKKHTGKTFSEYLNCIRIDAVCTDLLHTDLSISEISILNGFENLTYFNRVFKKMKNMTPKEFRKSYVS